MDLIVDCEWLVQLRARNYLVRSQIIEKPNDVPKAIIPRMTGNYVISNEIMSRRGGPVTRLLGMHKGHDANANALFTGMTL